MSSSEVPAFTSDYSTKPHTSTEQAVADAWLQISTALQDHPALLKIADRLSALETNVYAHEKAIATLAPAELHVRPQDPAELGEVGQDESHG